MPIRYRFAQCRLKIVLILTGCLGVVAGVVIGVSASSWSASAPAAHTKKTEQPKAAPQTDGREPIYVSVAESTATSIPNTLDALGSLSAVQTVTISAEVDGRISAINFKSGQTVGSGMPILQLDDAQAKADYQSAVTALNLARSKYRRSKALLNTAVSEQDLEQLKATVSTDEAAVKSKLATLNQKEVDAPFSGVLGDFKTQVGDYVSAGQALVSLVNIDTLAVTYHVPESELAQLQTGQLVTITVDSYPKKAFYGTVSFISPTLDPVTRTVTVRATIPNAKSLLRPGMFVHVEQQISTQAHAIVVPEQAVMADIQGYYVYQIVNQKAVKRYITIGARLNGQVEVDHGIALGASIVVAGQQKLEDGSPVKIVS